MRDWTHFDDCSCNEDIAVLAGRGSRRGLWRQRIEGRTHFIRNYWPSGLLIHLRRHLEVVSSAGRVFAARASAQRAGMVTYRPLDPLKAITAIYLLSPQIPMLFIGEEWGVPEPVPHICDFDEELNEKVRKGRREALSRLPGFDADDLMDPTARSTFEMAKLDWFRLDGPHTPETLTSYRSPLSVRHERIVPLLKGAGGDRGAFRIDGSATAVHLGARGWRQASSHHKPNGRTRQDCIVVDRRTDPSAGFG